MRVTLAHRGSARRPRRPLSGQGSACTRRLGRPQWGRRAAGGWQWNAATGVELAFHSDVSQRAIRPPPPHPPIDTNDLDRQSRSPETLQ